MKHLFYSFSAVALLAACTAQQPDNDPIASHINPNVLPQEDFFEYANGTWLAENPIPASQQSIGIFTVIDDTIQAQVYNICLQAAASENEKGSNKQKIGDLYRSGMDSVALNAAGIEPVKPYLAMIDEQFNTLKDLPALAAKLAPTAGIPFFRFYIGQDDKNSTENSVQASQGGLSLPDRRYYLDNDQNSVDVRNKFVEYATGIFSAMGYSEDEAQASATKLLALETEIAKVSRKREDTRDPNKNYNKMTVKDVDKLMADFSWVTLLNELGIGQAETIVIGQPEFFTSLNGILRKTDIATLRDYIKFGILDDATAYLGDDLYTLNFNFYSKGMRGIEEMKPRWKRVVDTTNRTLSDLVGQVYVDEYLPKGTKEKFVEIGKAIRAEFENHIKNLDWMSDATKAKALNKLNAVNMKLAYPDKWRDMSDLEITPDSYFQNMVNARQWSYRRMIAKLGQPVDRDEWHMSPQTYNAYYSPSNNEICIPGCNILVPGFEGRMPDDAILYAIIGGSTFGHEVTHGFDDSGCEYDEFGNLNNWWTDEDKAQFEAKTKLIVEQFNQYVPIDSLHINGENTQGENIADLGGLVMGFEAFKKTPQYLNNEIIGGFTPTQRYFLGHAQAWMMQFRPQELARRVKSDEHSPAKWRVLGPLQNNTDFYEAFGVKEGDPMWRPDSLRVKIW